MYRVDLAARAQRELRRTGGPFRERIAAAMAALADDPRPRGTAKLKGNLYRLRVGPYRIIYAVSDREQKVLALKIFFIAHYSKR